VREACRRRQVEIAGRTKSWGGEPWLAAPAHGLA